MKKTKTIEIDLEIYRLIETNRSSFDETETDILRRLLGLKSLETQSPNGRPFNLGYGVILPHGTLLKGVYKRVEYQAEIKDGWLFFNGERYSSLSGAAKKFSGPNGWKFWKMVKRPQDSEWIILNSLRKKESIATRQVNWDDLPDLDLD
jgi:hypothetical protein